MERWLVVAATTWVVYKPHPSCHASTDMIYWLCRYVFLVAMCVYIGELYLCFFFHEINRYFGISIKKMFFHGTESQQTPITVSCNRAFFGILQGFSPGAPAGTRGVRWVRWVGPSRRSHGELQDEASGPNRCHISPWRILWDERGYCYLHFFVDFVWENVGYIYVPFVPWIRHGI